MDISTNTLVLTLIVGARFIVPLWIPRFPLPAIIAALVLDGIDGGLLSALTTLPMDNYQSYDKALDIYYLTIAYLAAVRNWSNHGAVRIAAFLLYYRLVGVVMFEYFDNRTMLLIFPNTFEYFFIAVEAARLRWDPARISFRTLVGVAAAIWIVIKLPQEYWIHIAQRDLSDTLTANPILIPILAGVIAILVWAGNWIVTRKLPPAHHEPMLAAGNDLPLNHMQEAMLRYRHLSWRDQGLWEKVVLITLILAVFSMILPNTVLTGSQLAISIATIVILNTVVSELLTKRGLVPVNDILHFLTMLAINMALAAVAFRLLPGPGGVSSLTRDNLLFFFLMVSLLVTLFDRFRAVANMRNGGGDAASG